MSSGEQRRPVEVGITIAAIADAGDLQRFADHLIADVLGPLESASGREWLFHPGEVRKLDNDRKRTGADFVGEASLRLAEGSFDVMIVVTDALWLSGKEQIVSGIVSPLTRICVLSTRQIRKPGRGLDLPVDADRVRWNSATLLLNLIGRILGAGEGQSGAMAHFTDKPDRARVEPYVPPAQIRELSDRFIEPVYKVTGWASELWAHVRSIFFDPAMLFRALIRNRALLLPLRLPGLAAAAIAPVFVFTAEMWDAGLNMANGTAQLYAVLTVSAATLYLSFVLQLFLPRKDTHLLPRHLALANVVIFLTILFAMIGLFVMLVLFSLMLEIWVMPHQLAYTLPTLPPFMSALPISFASLPSSAPLG